MNYQIYGRAMRYVRKAHSYLALLNRDESRPIHVRWLAYSWANLVFTMHTALFNAAMREFAKRRA